MPCRDADVLVLPLDRSRVDDIPAERVRPRQLRGAGEHENLRRRPPGRDVWPQVVPSDARLDEVTRADAMKSLARRWPGLGGIIEAPLVGCVGGSPSLFGT